jgi:gliding motility-associated-like protein
MLEVSFNIMGPLWRVAKHNYTFTANTSGKVSGFDQTNTLQSFTFAANQNINPFSYVTVGSNTFVTFSINNSPTTFSLNQTSFSISIDPVAFTGNTYSICAATSTGVTISPNVPGNGGPWNFSWQPGNLNGNPVMVNPASSTIYTVNAITTVGNCANTITVAVTTTNCCNTNAIASASTGCSPVGATTTLSLPTVTGFTPAPNYTWTGPAAFSSNSQTVSFLNNNVYGTYTVTISNGPCSFSTTIVTSPLSQFTPVITNTSVTCNGGNNGNANAIITGGSAPFTYTWTTTPSQNTALATNLSSGNYTCYVTDALGCTFFASTQVNQPPPLSLNINSNTTLSCVGQPINMNANAGGGTSPYSYAWTNGPGTSNFNTTETIGGSYTYSVKTTDSKGCVINSTKTIFYSNTTIPVSVNNATVCQGSVVTLSATGANSYTWPNGGNNSDTYTFTANANSIISVIGNISGCSGTATANILVKPNPVSNIHSSIDHGCIPVCLTLGSSVNASITSYDWNINGAQVNAADSLFNYCFKSSGNFTINLNVKAVNGCSSKAAPISISAYPKPIADFKYSNSYLIDDPGISFTDESFDHITQWFWDFGDGSTSTLQNPKHIFEQTYLYNTYLVVQNTFGCSDTVHKSINFEELPTLYVPNSFTPNDDGENDRFFAKGIGITKFKLSVFDRWGEKIFECSSFEGAWDGTCKGEPVKQDSYVWMITFSSIEYKSRTITGNVLLMR